MTFINQEEEAFERQEKIRRQRLQEEEENKRKQEDAESDQKLRNMAMGDILNTGIPGGLDMDIGTPL